MVDVDSKIEKILKEGNVKAFSEVFKEFYASLYAWSRRYISDPDEAEDIVQNVFITVWEKRGRLQIRSSFKSYLYRMVSNSCLNALKHQEVKNEFARDFKIRLLEENNQRIQEEMVNENLNNSEILDDLKLAIEELPVNCREIFKMSRYSQMKNKEIAAGLNISVRTVETQIYRALKLLRKKLVKE
jgi:RNA polymerase sigma-70 factor (ECF subfamily)